MSKAETFTIEPRTVWPRFLLPALQSLPIPGPGSYRVHRLRWAGQMADLAPEEVARRVGATAWAAPGEKRKSIASILAAIGRGSPPMHLERSDSITYWLAVNKRALAELSITRGLHDLESLPAVAGLAASDASWVVEQLLALDDRAIRVEQHVSWFAHSQWDNELYREFDTAVRDGLASIAVQCVRSYFAFLSDYLWTAEGGFADADTKLRWSGQATYLFWVGRVGRGLYLPYSGLRPDEVDNGMVRTFVDGSRKSAAGRPVVASSHEQEDHPHRAARDDQGRQHSPGRRVSGG